MQCLRFPSTRATPCEALSAPLSQLVPRCAATTRSHKSFADSMAAMDTKLDATSLLAQRLQHLQDAGITLNPATANPGGQQLSAQARGP